MLHLISFLTVKSLNNQTLVSLVITYLEFSVNLSVHTNSKFLLSLLYSQGLTGKCLLQNRIFKLHFVQAQNHTVRTGSRVLKIKNFNTMQMG